MPSGQVEIVGLGEVLWDLLEGPAEQRAAARDVAAHAAMVKVILCGTNAAGEVEGLAQLRRVGDAIVVLQLEGWHVRKCRWLPDCPRLIPRQPRTQEPPPHLLH